MHDLRQAPECIFSLASGSNKYSFVFHQQILCIIICQYECMYSGSQTYYCLPKKKQADALTLRFALFCNVSSSIFLVLDIIPREGFRVDLTIFNVHDNKEISSNVYIPTLGVFFVR